MAIYYLSHKNFTDFIEALDSLGKVYWSREKELSSTREKESRIIIEEKNDELIEDYSIPGFRPFKTFKSFILPQRSKVSEYPDDKWKDIKADEEKRILLGLKACDLYSFSLLDKVFLEDPEYIDPFYKKRRDSMILVSSDCTNSRDSCFCTLIGNNPYAESGFDLNLSEIEEGYLVEAGSETGENILKELKLQEAEKGLIEERDSRRKKVTQEILGRNSEFEDGFEKPEERVAEGYDSNEGWELCETCVSCGACTTVCPVCYCFTLYDRNSKTGKKNKRFMVWDSCQFKGFAQMAGGMNPRFAHSEQFKNRYYHKFFRFFDRYDEYKCTGCGRCIDNCLGEIDMREVLSGINVEGEIVNE